MPVMTSLPAMGGAATRVPVSLAHVSNASPSSGAFRLDEIRPAACSRGIYSVNQTTPLASAVVATILTMPPVAELPSFEPVTTAGAVPNTRIAPFCHHFSHVGLAAIQVADNNVSHFDYLWPSLDPGATFEAHGPHGIPRTPSGMTCSKRRFTRPAERRPFYMDFWAYMWLVSTRRSLPLPRMEIPMITSKPASCACQSLITCTMLPWQSHKPLYTRWRTCSFAVYEPQSPAPKPQSVAHSPYGSACPKHSSACSC